MNEKRGYRKPLTKEIFGGEPEHEFEKKLPKEEGLKRKKAKKPRVLTSNYPKEFMIFNKYGCALN